MTALTRLAIPATQSRDQPYLASTAEPHQVQLTRLEVMRSRSAIVRERVKRVLMPS